MNPKLREHMRAAGVMGAGSAAFLAALAAERRCGTRIRWDAGRWYCPMCDFRSTGYMGGHLPYCVTTDGPAPDGGFCQNRMSEL